MFLRSSYCLWTLSNFFLSLLLFSPVLLLLRALQYQSESSRPHLPKLDLEPWYQELMVGSSQLCPPLPAKSLSGRRPVLQVEDLLSSFSSSSSPQLSFCCFTCCLWFTSLGESMCVCVCLENKCFECQGFNNALKHFNVTNLTVLNETLTSVGCSKSCSVNGTKLLFLTCVLSALWQWNKLFIGTFLPLFINISDQPYSQHNANHALFSSRWLQLIHGGFQLCF